MKPTVESFFHGPSCTLSYVVHDAQSSQCAIIDPVQDYKPASASTTHESADVIVDYVKTNALNVAWILETHAHADHLSGAPYLQQQLGGQIGIGAGICEVQRTFKDFYELEAEFPTDGQQFDHLFAHEETFAIGSLEARVISTLFMPDGGTARADFPGGDAKTLYRSLRRILELPADERIFVCHDYQPGGRELLCETTVEAQKNSNIHLAGDVSEADYIELRTARDANLAVPALLLPAIQVNIRGGRLPPESDAGTSFLKLPLNKFS
jgi:glyoxylase-like metal-dependent hydrolase (beta-lactamase superfamily II)